MFFNHSNNKKVAFTFAFIFILIIFSFKSNLNFAHAETSSLSDDEIEIELGEKIDEILGETETGDLDEFVYNDFEFDFFNVDSFKSLVSKILNGTYFDEYDSLFLGFVQCLKSSLKPLLSIFLTLVSIIILFELFLNLSSDKFNEIKQSVKLVFSIIIVLILLYVFKDISSLISTSIQKIFEFSRILFPIILSLILLSGSNSSYAIHSSLSVFLLNTGNYIFVYLLLPLAVSILLLSLFGSIFSSSKFSKLIDIFKSIFKYIIVGFFSVFGLFSAINMISSGIKDGVSLKLTKFAIKNYVPILGGYISDGFNFIHSCSVLIKNAFGVSGILILFFIVLKPLIAYIAYMIFFKVLSLTVMFIGNNGYSDMFQNISKCMSYFITILIGVFLILFIYLYLLIVSVSVVWWFINLWLVFWF